MKASLATFSFVLIFMGMVPLLASFVQYLLIGLHGLRNHYGRCKDFTPRVAFVLPAWNEAEVLGRSIDSLMLLSYPAGAWRIFVVDDASTDDTPAVLQAKIAQYPGSVVHLRRDVGGQGKAHTLNHGLAAILADDWAEAIMIMDADVLFEPMTLRRMTRHLADPAVGAVTAYVKEGSVPGNLVSRSVAFEYITAQAAARRAQNVIGALACLAGGAQLHSRANMLAIGGRIDTSTLAEDTFTTIKTQLAGKRVVFDGNALVWAEEPDNLAALWKQRLRWARGNLQMTSAFRKIWFRPDRDARLGGILFGIFWFSNVFMPVFMILGSIGLVSLYELDPAWAAVGFGTLWGTAALVYLYETVFSFLIDRSTARRTWFEGFMYPGLISLAIMVVSVLPGRLTGFPAVPVEVTGWGAVWPHAMPIVVYAWGSLCMLSAWSVYRLEKAGAPIWLRNILLVLIGYGPVMVAVSFTAMVDHVRKTKLRWDKTVKTGKVRIL